MDWNLLLYLGVLLEERHITKAANIVGITQPGMSLALKRLRILFRDDLLVSGGKGYSLTPKAMGLLPQIRTMMHQAQELVEAAETFDPDTTKRTFRLGVTDYFSMTILPLLLRELKQMAPGMTIVSSPRGNNIEEKMQKGEIDLATRVNPTPSKYWHSLPLLQDHFVCFFRKGHPLESTGLTKQTYLQAKHIGIDLGNNNLSPVEAYLRQKGHQRQFATHVAGFGAILQLLQESDSIVTLPSKMAEAYATFTPFCFLPHPFAIPPITLHLVWHHRVHNDAGTIFLREQIASIANQLSN